MKRSEVEEQIFAAESTKTKANSMTTWSEYLIFRYYDHNTTAVHRWPSSSSRLRLKDSRTSSSPSPSLFIITYTSTHMPMADKPTRPQLLTTKQAHSTTYCILFYLSITHPPLPTTPDKPASRASGDGSNRCRCRCCCSHRRRGRRSSSPSFSSSSSSYHPCCRGARHHRRGSCP